MTRGPTAAQPRRVGELLRLWRERRQLSQLDLATRADISTRHLSFVETGRSAPSRDLLLHLTAHLDLPLRERNQLLLAAGHTPGYAEQPLDAPALSEVWDALHRTLAGHEPYPAVVVDRRWRLVAANAGAALFTAGVGAELLAPPVNVLRLALHPAGLAPSIVNLGQWRAHLLDRLRRQLAHTADPDLADLHAELSGYPCDQPEPEFGRPSPGSDAVCVPLRLRHTAGELAFFSTVAAFGAPLEVTVAELTVESFFPADAHTAAVLRADAGGQQDLQR